MVVLLVERSQAPPDLYHRHPARANPKRSGSQEQSRDLPPMTTASHGNAAERGHRSAAAARHRPAVPYRSARSL
jgi:hypothetical protein